MPKNIHVIVLRTAVVLLVLVCLSTAMVTGRYARYFSSASSEDSARVAKFDVTASSTATQLVSIPIQPGETVKKFFTVENKSEVALELHFQVSNKYNNLPLTFQNLVSAVIAPGGEENIPLEITWAAETDADKDDDYIGKVDLLEISVQAVQVD